MKSYINDIPVAIIFFNRSDTLAKVFEQVKIAKPSKLFLIQDGPREDNKDDIENILNCRQVVESIDWSCEVYKDYSETNLGCGKRVFTGVSNAFKKVDSLIILEDDCVPSQTMFTFCKDILVKYKDDDRINMISGMNHLGQYKPNDNSYFFCKTGSIWGWATWKRVWDKFDYEMKFFENQYAMKSFENQFFPKHYINNYMNNGRNKYEQLQKGEKLTAWTYQFGMLRHLYSQLVIVPNVNLISNIGLSTQSTHSASSLKAIPKKIQKVFYMKSYCIEYPLKHPEYIITDTEYDKKVWEIFGTSYLSKLLLRVEGVLRRLFISKK